MHKSSQDSRSSESLRREILLIVATFKVCGDPMLGWGLWRHSYLSHPLFFQVTLLMRCFTNLDLERIFSLSVVTLSRMNGKRHPREQCNTNNTHYKGNLISALSLFDRLANKNLTRMQDWGYGSVGKSACTRTGF